MTELRNLSTDFLQELGYNSINEKTIKIINNEITGLSLDTRGLAGQQKILKELFQSKMFKDISYLDLSYNNLDILPDSVDQLTKLQTLHLDSNQLETLPDNITNLTDLKELDLKNNNINNLPQSISNLSRLETLNLDANKLVELPRGLYELRLLKYLSINNNNLKIISPEISNLTELEYFMFAANKGLPDIPEEILNLPKIRQLIIPESAIGELKEKFEKLKEKVTKMDAEAVFMMVNYYRSHY